MAPPPFCAPSIWCPLYLAPPSIWALLLGPPARDLFGGELLLQSVQQLNSEWRIISPPPLTPHTLLAEYTLTNIALTKLQDKLFQVKQPAEYVKFLLAV